MPDSPIHPAFTHPVLAKALATWCEQTGTDPDPHELAEDEEFTNVSGTLVGFDLLDFYDRKDEIDPQKYEEAAQRAALVLLGGVQLAELRKTPVRQATLRVADAVTQQLGTPTGYEGQPDMLARAINEGLPWRNI